MKETFAKLLKALGRIFDAFTTFADATNDLAKSVKNASEGLEASSRSLIPSQAEIEAEAEIASIQAMISKVEKFNELKLKLGNDTAAVAAIDKKIEDMKKKYPKSGSDSDK